MSKREENLNKILRSSKQVLFEKVWLEKNMNKCSNNLLSLRRRTQKKIQ